MSDIFNRLAMATKAAEELPAIISEINALLPDGWEVRRCAEHVAGGTQSAFKVGQKWKRRDGTITRIKAVTDDEDYPVTCSLGRMYSKSGFWLKSRESDIDLIELIEDAQARHEIDMNDWKNWRTGDVISCVDNRGDAAFRVGALYEISSIDMESTECETRNRIGIAVDGKGSTTNAWQPRFFKFHSRPEQNK